MATNCILSPAARKAGGAGSPNGSVGVINDAITSSSHDVYPIILYSEFPSDFDKGGLDSMCRVAGWTPNWNDTTKKLTLYPA